jgi:hypothetical protein
MVPTVPLEMEKIVQKIWIWVMFLRVNASLKIIDNASGIKELHVLPLERTTQVGRVIWIQINNHVILITLQESAMII